jgi:hypothetical protein
MPQFDLKGKGDFTGLASKTSGEYAAKNQKRAPGAKNPKRGEVTKSDTSETKKAPAAPGSLNYFMKKTASDGKGNARNRAYTLFKREKQRQRREG